MSNKYDFSMEGKNNTRAAFNEINKDLTRTNKNMVQMFDTSTRKGRNFRQNIQQVGYQFQDFAVQVGGGTNALTALGQQGSQLLGIFGPGGAIAGAVLAIASVVGVAFAPALFKSKKATDELSDALIAAGQAGSLGSNGIFEFKQELLDLAEVSETAAKVRMQAAINAATDALTAAQRDIAQKLGKGLGLESIFLGDLEDAVNSAKAFGDATGAALVTGVGRSLNNAVAQTLGESFGLAGEEAKQLGVEIVEMIANLDHPNLKNAQSVFNLEDRLSKLASTTEKSNIKLIKVIGSMSETFDKGKKAAEIVEQLTLKMKDLSNLSSEDDLPEAISKSSDFMVKLANDIAIARLELNGSSKEALELSFALQNGFNSFAEMPESAKALFEIKQDLTKEQLQQNEALKQASQNEKERLKTLEQYKASAERQKATFDNIVNGLKSQIVSLEDGEKAALEFNTALRLGLSTTEALPDAIQNQIDKLYELKEAQDSTGTFWENLNEHIKSTSENFDVMWGNTFNKFADGIGDATTQAIFQGQTFGDAMRTIARSAVSEVISGLVAIGVKKLALFTLEKTILAGSTAANAASAVTQGTIAANAWAPAAAFASLATGGTNAVPASAALTSTVALSKGLANLASFDGGGYTGDGARVGGLDGRGGHLAMVHPRETIIDHTKGGLSRPMTINAPITINGNADESTIKALQRNQKRFARMVQSIQDRPI